MAERSDGRLDTGIGVAGGAGAGVTPGTAVEPAAVTPGTAVEPSAASRGTAVDPAAVTPGTAVEPADRAGGAQAPGDAPASGVNAPASAGDAPASGVNAPASAGDAPRWQAAVARRTGETDVRLTLNLRGSGRAELEFPVPFLRHMLHLFAVHGRFDLTVQADGDVDVDDHHLVEDIGLCLGKALHQALGDKRGIRRYGERHTPMDETLARAVIDLSGRPAFVLHANIPAQRVGTFPTELVREFFKSFANEGRMALHLAVLYGEDSHHMIEALFKATAAALREATSPDGDAVPSSKGVLE